MFKGTEEGDLLDVQEAAAYLGIAVATLYCHNSRGTGPGRYRTTSGRIGYREADLQAWKRERADRVMFVG